MSAWRHDELERIGGAEEVEVAVRQGDGTLRSPVTVWLVRPNDDLYVRSAVKGRNAAWYRRVEETRKGHLSAGGVQQDVAFADVDASVHGEVDAAYRKKYGRYAGRILNSCLTPEARSTTLRITPVS